MYRVTRLSGRKLFLGAILPLTFSFGTFSQNLPPKAEVREVTDDYFGQKIIDPYRWMEDLKSDETQKWMKAQTDYSRAYLDKLPMREEILKELDSLSEIGSRVSMIQRRNSLYFYLRRSPDQNDFRLYVRDGLNGAERLLVDPDKIVSDGKRHSIDRFSVSQDGKYLSYISSVGGSEQGELRVIETATNRDMGELIDRTIFAAGEWLPDGKSFIYNRLPKSAPNGSPADFYQKSHLYLHVLGTNADEDRAVFGYGVNPKISIDATLIPFVSVPLGSKYMFATVTTAVSPNSELYVAPIDALKQNSYAEIEWHKIASLDDEISGIAAFGEDFYLTTYKDTPRYKVIHINLNNPDLKKADTVFPASEAVVEVAAAAHDALYVQTLDGGTRKIYRVDYKTKKAEPIKLPYQGSASIADSNPNSDGVYFELTSWTRSPANFRYDPKTANATETPLIGPINIDMSNIDVVNVKAKSYDGTMVPMVILYKKGMKRNGTNPVLMWGYGAYGIPYTLPRFSAAALPWLNRGGILVWSGVRGGGEYGEEWHLAGKKASKPNTWKDFIACAEFLIAEKYTSPEHLGIEGGSAGGILISNSIATRPDLFGAAISSVGTSNALRFETTPAGVANIPEFGTIKTEKGFEGLLAMDAYHKVKGGVKYPAVMFTQGINDTRVAPWESAKMAARLQAATVSSKPVLLRIDFDAGHGFGSTKKQRNEENADVYAFLFQQLK